MRPILVAIHGPWQPLLAYTGSGGKVDKTNPTQVGRTLQQLGIDLIPAYSPEARGRSERVFRTHQARLLKELAAAGITDMNEANRYLQDLYHPALNIEFMQPAREEGQAFVPYIGPPLSDILCEQPVGYGKQRAPHHLRLVRFVNSPHRMPALDWTVAIGTFVSSGNFWPTAA